MIATLLALLYLGTEIEVLLERLSEDRAVRCIEAVRSVELARVVCLNG